MRLPRLFGVLVVATALMSVPGAGASSYPVTSLANGGAGSLRAAIEAANDPAAADTIPIGVSGTIALTEPLPPITDDVAIVGPGASSLKIERAAATQFRIFNFGSGITTSLSGVTVTGGRSPEGAGIRNENGTLTLTRVVVAGNRTVDVGSPEAGASGGGVLSGGPLVVRESVIADNGVTARGVAGGGTDRSIALGGGIVAYSAVTVDRSTISGNFAEALGEGGGEALAFGGGLHAIGAPALVERSTISGNSALATGGTSGNEARGGGIQGGKLTLTSSTVTGNAVESDEGAEGANLQLPGDALIGNTIVADPVGDDSNCDTPVGSGGFNLDEDGSCGFGKATDLVGVAAGLDPALRDNGGPTPTHALLEDSFALDRGSAFGSAVDQRNLPRPVDHPTKSNTEGGDGADIGAFELQALPAPAPAPVLVSAVPGDRQPPNTRLVSGPARVTFKRLAKFRFASTEAQSTFQCKVDKGPWKGCRSPFKRKVSAGRGEGRKHVFRVRAVDRFGNVDRTPARFGWRVKKIVG